MATPTRHATAYLGEGWRVVRGAVGASVAVVLVWVILTNVAAVLCFVPLLVVGGPLTAGLYLFFAKRLVGLGGDVGDLFLGFRRFGPTTVVYLVATVAYFAVLLLLAAPLEILDLLGVIDSDNLAAMLVIWQIVVGSWLVVALVLAATAVGVVFTFGMPLALLDASPGALSRALAASRTHLGRVLALNLCGALCVVVATAAGLLLCLVGVLVLQPLAIGVLVVAQLALVRDTIGLDAAKLAAFVGPAASETA